MSLSPLQPAPDGAPSLADLLAYLNLSSGTPDPRFQSGLNELFHQLAVERDADEAPWQMVGQVLTAELERLRGQAGPWSDTRQARETLQFVFDRLLPSYLEHHRDLLFHQTAEFLFQPFFLARAFEAVLAWRPLGSHGDRALAEVLGSLNDFLGHRPVAVLANEQRMEPYPHERVRPVPIYLRGAGVGHGPYHDLITVALDILRQCDGEIRELCCLDLELLDELAVDPRAYDFEHPVNKRPNYHFGQWDPHHLDHQGRFRRFVLVQITLDVLLSRVEAPSGRRRDEQLWEAAAVLAGTMLMAAETSGRAPEFHDSTVTLATLLPRIAEHRDRFYQQLLARGASPHAEALREEAQRLRQPLGGARQHLNHALARLRARQQQHVHLARLFARMGYPEASLRQAAVVPAASARMTAQIDCRIVAAHHAAQRGHLPEAAALIPPIQDLLERAIGCGALVDPWNILGFQAQFSVFSALENSVRDHRVDELIGLVERIFGLYERLLEDAAATGDGGLATRLERSLEALGRWWDQFATSQVSGIRQLSGHEASQSAAQVAAALGAWHQAGAAAGDVAFWRAHVEAFGSPKSYALVITALLDKHDFVASRALLVQWLSRAEDIPLVDGEHSWHAQVVRWVREVGRAEAGHLPGPPQTSVAERRWQLVRKLLDSIEANAEAYWEVPAFPESPSTRTSAGPCQASPGPPRERTSPSGAESPDEDDAETDDEEEGHLYRAAYEDVIYRDSTRDGVEGDVLDEAGASPPDDQWEYERDRLEPWLGLLTTVSQVWRTLAAWTLFEGPTPRSANDDQQRRAALAEWLAQAQRSQCRWVALLESVHRHPLPRPRGTRESLIDYDRRRGVKQMLLERIVAGMVETLGAERFLAAALPEASTNLAEGLHGRLGAELIRRLLAGDRQGLREILPQLLEALASQRLLYLPLSRGGDPQTLAATQSLLQLLRELAAGLPRLGLLDETRSLILAAQQSEKDNPAGEGAVTEFDRLFHLAYRGLVECLIESAGDWDAAAPRDAEQFTPSDEDLVGVLQSLTESLLSQWLEHSRSLRLSVLERVSSPARWQTLVGFIERYGHDVFTLRFLSVGNLRAVLDTGVATYLAQQRENPPDDPWRLLDELGTQITPEDAARQLEIVVNAVLENYAEYRDFNSTTTQSDRGELLYCFLDFLRLKARYDRVGWNLKPVFLAHQMLERKGRAAAAAHWRRIVAERTGEAADWHQQRLEELSRKYGMRLPTVADRLGERFVRPLDLDRIRALVRPAIEQKQLDQPPKAFEYLEQEIAEFARQPTGSGLDLPGWLLALELEVQQVRAGEQAAESLESAAMIPPARLSRVEVLAQLDSWPRDE